MGVPAFIDVIVAEYYADEERAVFLSGIDVIGARVRLRRRHLVRRSCRPSRSTALLDSLDQPVDRQAPDARAWSRLKGLVVHGYFTSERVQKDVLKTEVMPGRFDGNAPDEGPREAPMAEITKFDAIVVGSGISGGWAAKELARARAQDDRARGRRADRSRDGLRRARAAVRDALPRLRRPQGARARLPDPARVLRLRRAGAQVLRERPRESVHGAGGRAVPLVPRPPGRRALDHVGPAGLSLERPRLHRQREGRPRQRLADPLRRHRALVFVRRAVHRRHRRARGALAAPRRRVPAADADDGRRGRGEREDPRVVRRISAS